MSQDDKMLKIVCHRR